MHFELKDLEAAAHLKYYLKYIKYSLKFYFIPDLIAKHNVGYLAT